MLRPFRPRPAYVACLVAAGLAFAGCGDSGDDTAAAPAETTPAATVPDAATTPPAADAVPDALGSANGKPGTAAKDDESQIGNREGDPALPAEKADDLEPALAGSKLTLESGAGEPKWRVSTRTEGEQFCVDAAAVGAADPPSMCSAAVVAALNLVAEGTGAQTAVNPVRRTASAPAQDVLVWGFVDRAVDRVVVEHAGKAVEAKVSKASEQLDLGDAPDAFGEGVQELPKDLRVKTFGVAVPVGTGNPPNAAKATSSRPVRGTVTLALQ